MRRVSKPTIAEREAGKLPVLGPWVRAVEAAPYCVATRITKDPSCCHVTIHRDDDNSYHWRVWIKRWRERPEGICDTFALAKQAADAWVRMHPKLAGARLPPSDAVDPAITRALAAERRRIRKAIRGCENLSPEIGYDYIDRGDALACTRPRKAGQ